MLKATEKDNVVLQKGEIEALDAFVNGLKPGDVATVPDAVSTAGSQMTAYYETLEATRQGGGTVSSLVRDELGDLGGAIVRKMTRLEQFVASIDSGGDDATRYSVANQSISAGFTTGRTGRSGT